MTTQSYSNARLLLAVTVMLCPAAPGLLSAQEKCKMKWEIPAANANYTQQHVIDVGDVPGHQIRIFELHRTFPNDQPNCEGLKRAEEWSRGYSDYIDRNGRAWGYRVIVLENGDKIFGEMSFTSQTVVAADGSKKSTATGVIVYTGGTGKIPGNSWAPARDFSVRSGEEFQPDGSGGRILAGKVSRSDLAIVGAGDAAARGHHCSPRHGRPRSLT
jgi:hypothetical protein